MNKDEIIQVLSQFYEQQHETYKIRRIGIFGSVARGEASAASDVDIVVDLAKPTLFKLIGIKQDLEDIFHLPVDIVHYRQHMDTFLKQEIDRDAVYVQ